ncbi:MAG TPA: integrase [Planctomycetaceae bacterium]|nr:integrase [Planctomycetaceae bacterium]
MVRLRDRMLEDMKLRGLSARTQEAYCQAVRQMVERVGKPPARVTEEDLRGYFVYLRDGKKYARASFTIALCGIRFFFEQTLGREWSLFDLVRPPKEKKLPVVLTGEEVRKILGLIRIDVYRVCLTTIYSCGLRLTEGAHLKVSAVDSGRMTLLVHGKGGKDRYVPLPRRTLALLREHWVTHRSPEWLFPAPTRKGLDHALAHGGGPVTRSSVQSAFRRAWKSSNISKHVGVHSLRHSYATRLLESGVNLRLIQSYLGHGSARTTQIYTHLTREIHEAAKDPINKLFADL